MRRHFSFAIAGLLASAALIGASAAHAQTYDFRFSSTTGGASEGGGGGEANCTTPWGVPVSHSQTVQAFLAGSVPFGETCQSESRICSDGALSGSFANENCVVEAQLAQCDLPWGGQVASGTSVEAFLTPTVAFGVTCTSEMRGCLDGTLSGAMTNETCVADAQDLTPNAFTLQPATGLAPGSWAATIITSVSGITGDVPISVSDFDHEASLQICLDSNCLQVVQPWTQASTTIRNGQFFQMRFRASDSLSATREKSVDVGTFNTAFVATTTATYCGGIARRCEDGSIFVGTHNGKAMFAVACDAGQTWNGAACVGTRDQSRVFGPQGEQVTGICANGAQVTCETGRENTAALAAAGSQYQVASYCAALSVHGHDDWYLPARNEISRMFAVSNQHDFIGSFVTGSSNYYYSSSELNTLQSVVWHTNPSPAGAVSNLSKNYAANASIRTYTRCVRSVG